MASGSRMLRKHTDEDPRREVIDRDPNPFSGPFSNPEGRFIDLTKRSNPTLPLSFVRDSPSPQGQPPSPSGHSD
ncbi:hypothetical protein NHX12_004858 [Muraenolepis orangiensis]|uniref:Uncharacterized protein n=1 Tax=Muraenolepis orangiensis TaxID=630683 RepID=A0A9Q0IEQ3_9TELE|nr:hypothetical protein NHX12_004858 [Muraenolepis orangiensis]